VIRYNLRKEILEKLAKREVKDIKLRKNVSISDFIKDIYDACISPYDDMELAMNILEEAYKDKDCIHFLGIPGYFLATGARGIISDLIRKGFVDVLVIEEDGLDYDIARSLGGSYYRIMTRNVNNALLHQLRVHRIGNLIFTRESHELLLTRFVLNTLDKMTNREKLSLTEILSILSRGIDDEDSVVRNAFKYRVTLIPTSIWRSTVLNLIFAWAHKEGVQLDILGLYKEMANIINYAKRTCAIIVSKEARTLIGWWNQFRGGIDYLVHIMDPGSIEEVDAFGDTSNYELTWSMIKRNGKYITIKAPRLFAFILLVDLLYEKIS